MYVLGLEFEEPRVWCSGRRKPSTHIESDRGLGGGRGHVERSSPVFAGESIQRIAEEAPNPLPTVPVTHVKERQLIHCFGEIRPPRCDTDQPIVSERAKGRRSHRVVLAQFVDETLDTMLGPCRPPIRAVPMDVHSLQLTIRHAVADANPLLAFDLGYTREFVRTKLSNLYALYVSGVVHGAILRVRFAPRQPGRGKASTVEYSIMEYRGIARSYAVEFATLGFLIRTPKHGYALRRELRESLGALWRIASSQLYSVLHRLEDKGWIEAQDEESDGGRLPRAVYRITSDGEAAFWQWATSPVRHLRDVRIELLAKLYFLRRLAPERVTTLVDDELDALRQLARRLAVREFIESDDRVFGRLALSFRTSQVASTLKWLEAHRDALADAMGSGEETE